MTIQQKIAIGCDEAAFALKQTIIDHVAQKHRITLIDCGCYDQSPVLYPNIAQAVAEGIANGDYDTGILLCGTGIGMSIVANKVAGIRAACCHDMFSASRAKRSNDAQVLTMGARVIGAELAKMIVDEWMTSTFQGGGSLPKVDLINKMDAQKK